ncbi:hypothetical protein LTR36_000501 [Oleoguttula mirabilis]|uniref:Uncharacterized protein n=1 Tax=Oleoguttula mirabilis TaxID=1507867 RepID=A0AAV9JPL9_9PEZI|nr:hypothetical protein LTR36_000501 [Oleoguttula mirabilis]
MAASTGAVITDDGFEGSNQTPLNSSASTTQITAQVVEGQAGPMQPYSGDNYLLITFNNSVPASQRTRRQSTAALVYNVTQAFDASAGVSYTFSAFAAESQDGIAVPECSISICGDNDCGPSVPLTTAYSQYSYQYVGAFSESSALATFSVQCAQSAYVALDNVSITSNSTPAGASALATTTVTQYVTRTQTLQRTETTTQISGSDVFLTTTATVEVGNYATKIYNFTIPTVIWSTATEVVAVAATKYYNQTVSEYSTTTTTITTTLNSTTTQYQPSLIYETATATTTALTTESFPASTELQTHFDGSNDYADLHADYHVQQHTFCVNDSDRMWCQYGQINAGDVDEDDNDEDIDCSLWGTPVPGDPGASGRYEFALTTNATLIAHAVPAVCPASGSRAASSSTSTAVATTSSPTPSAKPIGCAESATCPSASGQVMQGSDGTYFQFDCVNTLLESDNYLTTVNLNTTFSIGQCAAGCEAWNADSSNTIKCDYGQIQSGGTSLSCALFGESFPDGPGQPSGRYELAVTTNATLIAGATVCQAT